MWPSCFSVFYSYHILHIINSYAALTQSIFGLSFICHSGKFLVSLLLVLRYPTVVGVEGRWAFNRGEGIFLWGLCGNATCTLTCGRGRHFCACPVPAHHSNAPTSSRSPSAMLLSLNITIYSIWFFGQITGGCVIFCKMFELTYHILIFKIRIIQCE